MLNLVKMGASTALAARSGWSIWPGMPGQFAPEWGGQFDAESMVTFRRNQVVNISGISSKQGTHYIIITDPEYIVDRVKMQNSLAGNFLFTWNTDGGPINWSKNNFVFAKRGSLIPAVLVGTQVQQVFAGDTIAPKGFKLRPLATGNLSYLFFKANNEFDPIVRLLADYTQRITAVNQTNDGEKWTHIFRAEADYYILLKPVKLSVGATFLNGSDIFAGLKQQQYFLLSLNFFAGKTN